ncbi:MAG: TetR/AcrR family transcriptional regulator [Rhodothermaceae bacterium]|nr:TetR/AcrR family transcriptional regulator [Rhodothermaceae bacterium]
MEAPVLSRRDRERLARRQAMLDAALAVFAEKGYEGATLDEVAERAEFGKGTLYNYFPGGKESILFALLDEVYDGLVAIIEAYFTDEAEQHRPTRALFRDFIAALIAYFSERQAVFMIMVKEAQRLMLDGNTAARIFAQRERLAETTAAPIQAAMDRGALRPMDAHGVAHMLMGNVHGYMMYASCPPVDGDHHRKARAFLSSPEKGADFIATILFDGLLTEQARA